MLIALKVGSGASAQHIVDVGAALKNNTPTTHRSGRTCECVQSTCGVSGQPVSLAASGS